MLRTAETVGTVLLQQELGGLEEGADAQVSGHSLQFVDAGIEILLLGLDLFYKKMSGMAGQGRSGNPADGMG